QPHSTLRDVPGLGLGYRRCHPGAVLPAPVLLGDLPERSCPPAVHQDRGQRHLLQRHHHRLPAAPPWSGPCANPADSAGRATGCPVPYPGCTLPTRSADVGNQGSEVGMSPALLARLGAAGCLAASGVLHAQLYLHGYRVIPWIGPTFLLKASGAT